MYEKNWSKIKTKEWKQEKKKEQTMKMVGCVQDPEHSCLLDHKSHHILRKRLLTFLHVVQRFPKPGMAQTIFLFPITQYLYSCVYFSSFHDGFLKSEHAMFMTFGS
jgi:hypothetical protein